MAGLVSNLAVPETHGWPSSCGAVYDWGVQMPLQLDYMFRSIYVELTSDT